jgi:hypothetical protein
MRGNFSCCLTVLQAARVHAAHGETWKSHLSAMVEEDYLTMKSIISNLFSQEDGLLTSFFRNETGATAIEYGLRSSRS